MADLPTGTVTFLFTDLEDSTRLWEEYPDAMKAALARHDEILRGAIAAHGGHIVKGRGDGVHAAFGDAHAAVAAALDAQRAITSADWEAVGPLRVRMGVHTGPAEFRDGDYYGTAVNRASRLMSVAHGGQVVVSLTAEELLQDADAGKWELVDLGDHRLPDLQRAERVFQLSAVGLPQDFPPLRSVDAYPTNLPIQLSSFVGRAEEMAAVQAALQQSRAVTLTGVGGSGKTRLAQQVGGELLADFPDGVWLCELAPATDADVLAQIVAAAVGVTVRANVTVEDSIISFLRTRSALLLLDNCEHLIEAAGRLAKTILSNCRAVRVLATSREGLGLEGEQVLPLRSLPVPDPRAGTVEIAATDAVRLFSERAKAARAGFAIDESNVVTIAEICRRLDGMPLAIELASARVAAMRPVEIAALLDERFRLLTGGRRTAVERQQTLRATVDWSYALLDERDRLVFDRLSVFAGSFDSTGATAVVSDERVERWDVLDAITSLTAKSMLVDEEGPDGKTRYSMLETLRQYARERLDENGDVDDWRRRHAEYYTALTTEIGRGLRGPDEILWRRRFHVDLDNVRAAVNWALDATDPADADYGARIIASLTYESLSQTAGIGLMAERALEHLTYSSPGVRSDVFAAAAWCAFERGDFELLIDRASVAIGEGLAESEVPGFAHMALSQAFGHTRRFDLCHAAIDDGFRTLERFPNPFGELTLTVWAAFLATSEGDFVTARARAVQGLERARETGSPTLLTGALCGYARAIWHDEPDAALAALDEVIDLIDGGASNATRSESLQLSAVLRVDRDPGGALRALREAVVFSGSANLTLLAAGADRGAVVCAAIGAPIPAAVLLGAAQRAFAPGTTFIDAIERADQPVLEARLRAELGDDGFDAEASRGAAMSPIEVVDYAVAALDELIAEAEDG
jgi:predicted ATPase/class 3 adenylate cyclase